MATGDVLTSRGSRLLRVGSLVVLFLYVALALVYSVANPILESPDEIAHYGYIEHLVRRRDLPVQRPGVSTIYEQEGSQPPLYYVAGALLVSPWGIGESVTDLERNPHALVGIGLARENRNVLIHSDGEAWPWTGIARTVHILRLYSIALGALTVWGTLQLAQSLFPSTPSIALGSMAFAALNPMFIYLSSSVNNDNLTICISTWALVVWSRVIVTGPTMRRALQAGTLAGLGALTKVSGLLLFPVGIAAFVLAELTPGRHGAPDRHHTWRTFLAWCISFTVVGAAIGGWWYARNIALYGEFTGIAAMLAVFGVRDAPMSLRSLFQEFKGFRMSYWGLLGAVNIILHPGWANAVFETIFVLGLGGAIRWVAVFVRSHESPGPRRPSAAFWRSMGLLVLWIVALHLSLLRWTSQTYASQARLIFPALGALSLLVVWGLCAWFPTRLWGKVIGTAVVLEAVVALAVPWTTIAPAYRIPDALSVEQIPQSATHFRTRYGDAIELVAYELEDCSLEPGESTMVTLYWHALAAVDRDYSVYIHIFGRNGDLIAFRDSLAGMGLHPSSRWQPGEVVKDSYEVRISPDATAPVAARLNAGLYVYPSMERLPVADGLGREVLQPTLGYIKIEGTGKADTAQHPLAYTLGGGIKLLGYELDSARAAPGDRLRLTLYWETAPLEADYTVFVHLVAKDGTLIGQGDAPPMQGEFPTSYWGDGERIADEHVITIASDAPPGEATILVGLYREDGQRLDVRIGDEPAGDTATAGTVTIVRP